MRSGILLVDKPSGVTSHDVTHSLAGKFGVKAGHAGTLDRFATGLLIVCIEKATRASEYFMHRPKEYIATAHMGKTTDTLDREGTVTSSSDLVPSRAAVEAACGGLRGAVKQTPPLYSAKKIKGRRASDYARKGVEVPVTPVDVTVEVLDILRYRYPELELRIVCSAGTYVRSLVRDIGNALSCGAYTKSLARLKSGDFSVRDAAALRSLLDADPREADKLVIPLPDALGFLHAVTLDPSCSRRFGQGAGVRVDAPAPRVRVFDEAGGFIGIGRKEGEHLVPEKVIDVKENAS